MGIGIFIGIFIIPFLLAVIPGVVAVLKVKRQVGTGWHRSKPLIVYGVIYLGLLSWSYFNVWSLMFGPMSKEDWGPGIVTAIGVVFFQLAPLVVTVPMAIFVTGRHKT